MALKELSVQTKGHRKDERMRKQRKQTPVSLSHESRVLITGIGGPAGKAAAHFFGEREFFVLGIDIREIETKANCFLRVPPAVDSSYIPNLLSLIEKFNISLLVPTVTEELVAVSQAKNTIKELGCYVFVPSPKYTRIANDKFLTAKYLREHGLPSPKTVLQEKDNSLDALTEIFEFPILSKPRFGRGGRGVTVYYSKEELNKEKRDRLIFQEFISGEEYNANTFTSSDGKISKNFILKKTALKDGIVGNALSVRRSQHSEVAKVSAKVVKALKLEGPADLDIRLKANGSPAVLEVNARIGANVLATPEVLEELIEIWRNCYRRDE